MPLNGLVPTSARMRPSVTPFQLLMQRMDDVLGDGGILKEVVHPGEGPPVPLNASVLMYYSGFLEYSDQPYESNTYIKHPPLMKLGKEVTLAGLEMGLLTMKRGEFSRFLFQPRYAYGDMGCPPLIPASATILYEVQLLDYLDSGLVDDYVARSPEEQNAVSFPMFLTVVNTLRSFGNRCFNQSRYENAKDNYKRAATLLGNRTAQSEPEKEKIKAALLPLHLNCSLTELRLENPRRALKYGKKALAIDATNTKALYRCGQAYMELSEYECAQSCLISAQARKPFDSDINNLLRKVAMCYKSSLDKEKDIYSKMFSKVTAPEKM
ncbi:inactive peptidyl-prolyl cis-trans isomerase FKBP6 [Nothobranchius furzeri]|uniref:peptidylprolyl isomerase n=1 Tax=Nothobranchius furzeri TaxID=105023 RepID=A0A9D3C712_NOTFU|nr:inactive peptidyl-prolyl cis-trans isomerase FKBP6 [Nothobranchius furzeri]KAF7231173.1 FK506 binding protein 6 [Nothobranchius furzeri]